MIRFALPLGFAALIGLGAVWGDDAAPSGAAKRQADSFSKNVAPLLAKYCASCHGGMKPKAGLALDGFKDQKTALTKMDIWAKVATNLTSREMPPKEKPQPTQAERERIVNWIDAQLAQVDCTKQRDPGRVTIRRLNKVEYNNTIRDLVGVNFRPADNFPSDDVGYGFDNIGDVLSMSPILMEKYLAAAERILDEALKPPVKPEPTTRRFQGRQLEADPPSAAERTREPPRKMTANGTLSTSFDFPMSGEYVLKIRAFGDTVANEPPRMTVELDRKELKSFDIRATRDGGRELEVRTNVSAGSHRVGVAFHNAIVKVDEKKDPPKSDEKKDASKADGKKEEPKPNRSLTVVYLEVHGPTDAPLPPPSESFKRIMVAKPAGSDKIAAARKIIESFATRAYRRPVASAEVDRLLKLFEISQKNGDTFDKSIQLALSAVLVSPHFLFKIEIDKEPFNPAAIHPINQFELATRLSYFLWSSMPDQELFDAAAAGRLRDPETLEAQVRRMLKHGKASALVENFTGQWLQLRNLKEAQPNRSQFPGFDDRLRDAMRVETELFFKAVMDEDRSILDFIDANFTFVNERLAKHYAISNVSGNEFRKVSLPDDRRGGVLTHASVLTVTSNPTRTSPVKRGKYILENFLGTPPPPPAPDAGELAEDQDAVLKGSLRQRMEQHRANPNCATCHQKMDPLGFGLENFDAIGIWRTKDGKFDIDPAGVLPDGSSFSTPAGLRAILRKKDKEFARCLTEKMLTYALGRGLENYDKCAVDDITKALVQNQYRFSTLVLEIVKSEPFQLRRGRKVDE